MSYEPTNWKAGDTITSAKLNKIEQGIGGAVSFIHAIKVEIENTIIPSDSGSGKELEEPSTLLSYYYKLDKTYEEISAAMQQGLVLCLFEQSYDEQIFTAVGVCSGYMTSPSEGYGILILDLSSHSDIYFISDSNDGELIQQYAQPSSGIVQPENPVIGHEV